MNYLAHLYLAGRDPEAWLGSLMGDFAKGAIDSSLPPGIRQNIELHRRIKDGFQPFFPALIAYVAETKAGFAAPNRQQLDAAATLARHPQKITSGYPTGEPWPESVAECQL